MRDQISFSDIEYQCRKRVSKRERFLNKMESILPWSEMENLVEPFYPSHRRGRPSRGVNTMLRMYLLHKWFNLSSEGIEDAIYDSYAMRKFLSVDFTYESVPDSSTLQKFRRLIELHDLEQKILDIVDNTLVSNGLSLKEGFVNDATLVRTKKKVID